MSPDRRALVTLYNAAGGPTWIFGTNWLSEAPIGEWRGVITDADGRVTVLNLSGNRLSGEIPSELGTLSNLQLLSLSNNRFVGEIPAELGNLSNLEELYLSNSWLTGEIPAELGNLSNLKELYLSNNRLSGEIPSELGGLADLQGLNISGNQLTGEIPSELGNLSSCGCWASPTPIERQHTSGAGHSLQFDGAVLKRESPDRLHTGGVEALAVE